MRQLIEDELDKLAGEDSKEWFITLREAFQLLAEAHESLEDCRIALSDDLAVEAENALATESKIKTFLTSDDED